MDVVTFVTFALAVLIRILGAVRVIVTLMVNFVHNRQFIRDRQTYSRFRTTFHYPRWRHLYKNEKNRIMNSIPGAVCFKLSCLRFKFSCSLSVAPIRKWLPEVERLQRNWRSRVCSAIIMSKSPAIAARSRLPAFCFRSRPRSRTRRTERICRPPRPEYNRRCTRTPARLQSRIRPPTAACGTYLDSRCWSGWTSCVGRTPILKHGRTRSF